MNIFNILKYKAILKAKLVDLKAKKPGRYTFEALARACRVQKTYLSKVLNHDGNLSADQLYRACEFLKFSEDEFDYIYLVYEYETTQVDLRKKKIFEKITAYRRKYEVTESHIEAEIQKNSQTENLTNYYADPHLILVHMFCTVERFAKNPDSIGEFLGISKQRTAEIVTELCEMGVLKRSRNSIEVLKDNTHLSKLDTMYKVYRLQTRMKALELMNKEENPYYSFSVVFSSTARVREHIQENFMNFLKQTQKLVQNGEEEEVYQMNFDLLNWTEKNHA